MKRDSRTKPGHLTGSEIELHLSSFQKLASKQDGVREVRSVEDKCRNFLEMMRKGKLWETEILENECVDRSKLALCREELHTCAHVKGDCQWDASEVDHQISTSGIQ